MNTYAIADLHGRYDLLCLAIDAIEADASGGTFIVLGDMVDRGPQSREIVERLMTGPQTPNWRWIVLQGNHEAIMLECLGEPHKLAWWIGNGGGQTLTSYGYRDGDNLFPLRIPGDHLRWLAELPTFHVDTHRIFVHAGVPFDVPVESAKRQTLQWLLYPGDVQGRADHIHPDLPHCSGKHLVHGHHQSPDHPLLKAHRTNLDAFAWKTGRLPIGVFDDSQGEPVRIIEVTQ